MLHSAGMAVVYAAYRKRKMRYDKLLSSGIVVACLLNGATSGQPVVVEPGWMQIREIDFANPMAARFNPVDGLIYVGRRGTSSDGLYTIDQFGFAFKQATGSNVAAVLIDHDDGDAFFSEDYGGGIFRVAFGELGDATWVSGWHSGDDDPVGMAIAPATYAGSVLSPGEALVTDRGHNGLDEIWRWSPDIAEGETAAHADDGTLVDALDVAIDDTTVWIVDGGLGADGAIYQLAADGTLTPLPTTSVLADPVGIAIDPLTGDLLVYEGGGLRVVRIDPASGAVSDVITGFLTSGGAAWAAVDIAPDGLQLIVTDRTAGKVYVFGRCDPSGDPGADCDGNGLRDLCDIALGNSPDCNFNGVPDGCDLDSGASEDCNLDGVPDECPFCPEVELVFLMDTSASMTDEGAALCNSIDAVIARLDAAGIDLLPTKLGIWDMPGGQFDCLENTVILEFGTDQVPGSPPPGNEILGDCPGGNEVGQEDWGRAISIAAGIKPWLADSLRLVVPLSDEGPWCGDPITAEDHDAIDHAITIALANDVIVSPITGTGSSSGVIAQAQEIADATGGIQFTSTEPADDIAQAILDLVLDACFAATDCNGNGTIDSCDIDDGTSDDDNANGIPDECECPADLDGDGQVGVTDFLALLAEWGPNPGHPADLDGDGQVGVTDFLALLAAWGPCP
jgi:hypothetical protein